MSNDPATDLEPLCKLEDTIVRWLKSLAAPGDGGTSPAVLPWTYDQNSTRHRIYRGFENEEVAQNRADKAIPHPEGLDAVSEEPSEGAESSTIDLPCIVVTCESADCIGPDFCGNYEVACSIEVVSNEYDSSHADHRARVNDVMRVLFWDDILTQLKAFDVDFDASKVVFLRVTKRSAGAWVHSIELLFRHYTPKLIPES
jgi:hypothetical protein